MKEKLYKLVKNEQLVEKILHHYDIHNKKTSHAFLMHKFKFNSSMAYKIMDIVNQYEKDHGIVQFYNNKNKKVLKDKKPLDQRGYYLPKFSSDMGFN